MAQVALNSEIRLSQGKRVLLTVLQPTVEFLTHRFCRQIRHVADHARQTDTSQRCSPAAVVVATLPIRIGHDRVPRDGVPGHALAAQTSRARDRDGGTNHSGIGDRPFEGLHPAQRTAGDGQQRIDTQRVEESLFGAHHVADGDHREVERIGLASRRVDRTWACRAAT